MRQILGATCIAMFVVLTSGCGGNDEAKDPKPPKTFTVYGNFNLEGAGKPFKDGAPCAGDEGYADIQEGTQIVIKDAVGKKVSVGALGAGTSSGAYSSTCSFDINVPDVPAGESIYSIEVSHRGEYNFKRADVDDAGTTTLKLSLGG